LEVIVVLDEQTKSPFQELCILEKYYKNTRRGKE